MAISYQIISFAGAWTLGNVYARVMVIYGKVQRDLQVYLETFLFLGIYVCIIDNEEITPVPRNDFVRRRRELDEYISRSNVSFDYSTT